MTNVIARVSCGPACENAPAVLVNAHYDSPLGSPGNDVGHCMVTMHNGS